MKPITEKQINTLLKLARVTKTQVNNIKEMTSFEASKLITALIEKMNKNKKSNDFRRDSTSNVYQSEALAGLAVKILAQRCEMQEIIGDEDRFKKKVVELYKVFSSAKKACFA